jgi:hypothetical protein
MSNQKVKLIEHKKNLFNSQRINQQVGTNNKMNNKNIIKGKESFQETKEIKQVGAGKTETSEHISIQIENNSNKNLSTNDPS